MNRRSKYKNVVGTAIKRNRNHNKMTAKELGVKLGFSENTADTRVSQYEMGERVPSPKLTKKMADVLGVSVQALLPLDISTEAGVFHTLMRIMDLYDFRLEKVGDVFALMIPHKNSLIANYLEYLYTAHTLYMNNAISNDDYMYIIDCADSYINSKYLSDTELAKRENIRVADDDFVMFNSTYSVIDDDLQETFSRIAGFIQNMIPDDKEVMTDEIDEALGKIREVYDERVLDNTRLLLQKKMRDEQAEWLCGVKQLPVNDIITLSSFISIREQIIESITESDYLNMQQVATLIALKNPLEECVHYWSSNLNLEGYGLLIEEAVKDCINNKIHK